MENIRHIIESLLFVAGSPLTLDGIKKAVPEAETPEIREALDGLRAEYSARKGGFYLNEVAGGYQLRTRPEFTEWIKRLLQPKPPRLSRPALETLAIIAWKQPIIRSDIEHIRGVDSGGVLRVLLERKLVRILGRRKIPGRPLIYATTKLFLEAFDLRDLGELPTPKEIEALVDEATDTDDGGPEDVDPNQMQLFGDSTAPEPAVAAEPDEPQATDADQVGEDESKKAAFGPGEEDTAAGSDGVAVGNDDVNPEETETLPPVGVGTPEGEESGGDDPPP